MSHKRENFVRLAETRVNRALREIRLVGNLSNRAAYQFDEADIRKIFGALQKGIETAKGRFADADGAAANDFKL